MDFIGNFILFIPKLFFLFILSYLSWSRISRVDFSFLFYWGLTTVNKSLCFFFEIKIWLSDKANSP